MSPTDYALLALRDCKVIRAPVMDERYFALVLAGLAWAEPVSGTASKCNFRLTVEGEAAARRREKQDAD